MHFAIGCGHVPWALEAFCFFGLRCCALRGNLDSARVRNSHCGGLGKRSLLSKFLQTCCVDRHPPFLSALVPLRAQKGDCGMGWDRIIRRQLMKARPDNESAEVNKK